MFAICHVAKSLVFTYVTRSDKGLRDLYKLTNPQQTKYPIITNWNLEGYPRNDPLTYVIDLFDVRKSVHHHTLQIIQPKRCNSFSSLLLDVYVCLNMFRASPRPSSGAYNCTRRLWFYRWREAAGALLVVSGQTMTNKAPAASLQR